MGIREGISWGYKDPLFDYHWGEAGKMHTYRMNDDTPVGRIAYHVIYPGENVKAQVENCFKNIGNQADWKHDVIAIDAELDHNQSKGRITYALNEFGRLCKVETGILPILYSRYYWLIEHTNISDLDNFEMWLAQYLFARPYPLYTPEYAPPPKHFADRGWKVHQGSSKGKGDDVGVLGKHYVDHNRWNGGVEAVKDYFNFAEPPQPPMTLEERVARLELEVFGE
jgi:GH25 family lysozyme M1 (1,4-beta-N-acetylmuramidase)